MHPCCNRGAPVMFGITACSGGVRVADSICMFETCQDAAWRRLPLSRSLHQVDGVMEVDPPPRPIKNWLQKREPGEAEAPFPHPCPTGVKTRPRRLGTFLSKCAPSSPLSFELLYWPWRQPSHQGQDGGAGHAGRERAAPHRDIAPCHRQVGGYPKWSSLL